VIGSDQIVRQPVRVRERSSRTFDQRLSLRFPWIAAWNARLISKLPPRSRVRQAALGRSLQLSVEAFNRRDLDAVAIGWHHDFEYHPDSAWVEGGLVEPCYRGLEAYREYVATVDEVWGGENYLRQVEAIDLGDRGVVLAHAPMRAQASGVPLTEAYALVVTLKDGRMIHGQEYYDHAEALKALGLYV
jgi:ketosteroid isomerase-like protein